MRSANRLQPGQALPRRGDQAILDGYVIGQDRSKKKLAVAVYNIQADFFEQAAE